MIEKLKQNLGLILVLAAGVGLPWWFFNYMSKYALCEDLKNTQQTTQQELKNIQQEFNYRFQGIQLRETEQRLINFTNECKKNPSSKTACDEMTRLQAQQKREEAELKELGKKK